MGYVIQHVGLFPHQTIARERRDGAAAARLGPQDARRARADELLDLVGLDPRDVRRPLPAPALRRPAPARRRGPRAGRRPAGAAHGRAVRRGRPDRARRGCRTSSCGSSGRCARRSCSSRTTSTRPCASATGSRCSRRAAGWSSTPRPRRCWARPATDFVADFVGADRGPQAARRSPRSTRRPRAPAGRASDDRAGSAASERCAREGARWAVVLGDGDALHGWVGVDAHRRGTVGDRARRMEAWVPVGASLKRAFSEMLQHDAGWVAVLDGDRYLGVLTPATPARGAAPVGRGRHARRRPRRASSWTSGARA